MKMKRIQDFIYTILFQYYEMSYGLNVEMHKQVGHKINSTDMQLLLLFCRLRLSRG